MRGTLIARAIVANDRTPSELLINCVISREGRIQHTHAGHNLCFHPKLIRKSSCKIRDTSFAISCHIRDFSYVIEHVAARKQQNRDQAKSSPEISILYDWQNVGICYAEKADDPQSYGSHGDKLDIIQWSAD